MNTISYMESPSLRSLIYITLLEIAKKKGIDENDTIEVIIYSIENRLNPVEEFRKAFFK